MIYDKNIDIQHMSLQEFCGREECDNVKVNYQNYEDDDEVMHDNDNEPIKFKINGMEDGDKAEIEIEKSSNDEDSENSEEYEEDKDNDCSQCGNEEKERCINMDAKNVPVYQDKSANVDTYYVRLSDVREFMEMNDLSITEALDNIIMANENSSVDADNMFVYYEESDNINKDTINKLNCNGVKCVNKEACDKKSVDEGCSGKKKVDEACSGKKNPIKEMKKNPETVNVAATQEGYFISGSDLSTYMEAADIDDVAEALNNIINVYEESDMDANNIHVVLDESSINMKDDLEKIDVKIQL